MEWELWFKITDYLNIINYFILTAKPQTKENAHIWLPQQLYLIMLNE